MSSAFIVLALELPHLEHELYRKVCVVSGVIPYD